MPITKRVSDLAKKEGIEEITIASSEGLPITSNSAEMDRESAEGVAEVHRRLLQTSGMKFLTFVDGKGMKVLYHDDKFYYIVRSPRPVNDSMIAGFRRIVDSETQDREKEREKRELEVKRLKAEREKRELEIKRLKEQRKSRETEVKQIKEKHETLAQEVKKIKEAREQRKVGL